MLMIPGHTIHEQLYEGRKSVVYRGVRDEDQRPIVVKIPREAYPTAKDIARVRHEFRINRNLMTGGVVGIIEAISLERHGNGLATVLEDINGVTLSDLVAYGRVSTAEFLDVAIKVSKALAEIHAADVIHKDIKPQNIIINRDTGVVRITDFGVSTQLSREQQKLVSPTRLEGTLAYMAPEQTGRMNRPLDYRCDLYSLGCTFYELLTRRRPFRSEDPMEVVHAHIAIEPTPPHEIDPTVPTMLSAITLKLMAKTADGRYQSAHGLMRDLQRCRQQVAELGGIEPFEIGTEDVYARFVLPQKLYGRSNQVHDLMMAFERAADGRSESLFVGGYSGVGKSALVSEVKRPIVKRRGYFVSGKIDQHQRSVPYSVFIQAFGELVRQILTEPAERIATWRAEILKAVGDNGAVITDLIPGLELIIGEQGHVAELSAAEANNRFNSIFMDFVSVFARPNHPLVIFLDDLQWADTPSLKLLSRLASAPEVEYLLIIGAYRDNEVTDDHPCMVTISEIERAGGTVTRMNLHGLGVEPLTQFVADALHSTTRGALKLSQLVLAKTRGNPFFVGEFLMALYREGLIRHDPAAGWKWDIDAIAAAGFTSNVVEMMTERIRELGEATLRTLSQAACIGNRFTIGTLAAVAGTSRAKASLMLWPAVQEGLIAPTDDNWKLVTATGDELTATIQGIEASYVFVHDRVQQAAYELMPEDEQIDAHLHIGRTLLGDRPFEEIEDQVFKICNHFAVGINRMSSPAERYRLAKLSYIAGKKAKRSAAYDPAIEYFRAGIDLLGDQMWADSEGMSMGLAKNLSECIYLTGQYDEAEKLFDEVLAHCHADLELAAVYNLKVVLYASTSRYNEAIACGVQALKHCGIKFSPDVSKTTVIVEVLRTKWLMRGKSIDSLEYLPELAEPRLIVAVSVINEMAAPAFFLDTNLYTVLVLKMLHVSLAHGNSELSSYSYALYGMICGAFLSDFESGLKFGELALRLNKKYQCPEVVAKIHFIMGIFINPWRNDVRTNLEYLSTGYKEGRVAGDLVYTGYSGLAQIYSMLVYGEQLDLFFRESHRFLEFLRRTGDDDAADCIVVMQRMVLCLQGMTTSRMDFGDDSLEEKAFLKRLTPKKMKIPLYLFHILKMRCMYVFGEFEKVLEHADLAAPYAESCIGLPFTVDVELLQALAALRMAANPDNPRGPLMRRAKKSLKKLKLWSDSAPNNYLQKVEIVRAEMARVRGDNSAAINAFEVAMAIARNNNFIQDEAIACELAGRFHQEQDRFRMARSYLTDARYAYARWGALEKVSALEDEFPVLKHAHESTSTTITTTGESTTSGHGAFDILSVMKASQAISSEIVLEKLLRLLLRTVIENAGARRGVLLLERDGEMMIQAEGTAQSDRYTVLQQRPITGDNDVASTVINFVTRTAETVVLHDASEDARFAQDRYIQRHRPRSVLVAPIHHASDLIGVLYLENNLNTGVFTKDRLEVIQMLSSQIAISIENATLYQKQEEMAASMSRFVPTGFLEVLGKRSILNVGLGDAVQREMTVLFSDIRSFTAMCEQMQPQQIFNFINEYLRRVGPVIRQYRGFIDKYIGDAIMALFPHRADDALHAAVALQRHVTAFNVERAARGEPPISIGVGLHLGQLMLGTIGEEARLEGTVIADAVNMASRFEGLTKMFGAHILVSGNTLESMAQRGRFKARYLGEVQLRGRTENTAIYEIFDSNDEASVAHKEATRETFERGVKAFIKDDLDTALASMKVVLASDPQDAAAQYYFDKIAAETLTEPGDDDEPAGRGIFRGFDSSPKA